jgi:GLPGLI family protein
MTKLTTLCISALLLANASQAQKQEGVITYETKMNMHRSIKFGGDNADQMKSMMPEFRVGKMVLYFNENESIYKAPPAKDEDDNEDQDINSGNGQVRMKFNAPKNEVYINAKTERKIEFNDLFGKKFLIDDSLKTPKWKIEAETKKIAGYDCTKATLAPSGERKNSLEAWFTSEIVNPSGPNFSGLPGMILEIDIDNKLQVYTAKNIEFRKLTSDELKAPTGGKKVTRAEFRKLQEDRLKELGMPAGGGGPGIKMIIKSN